MEAGNEAAGGTWWQLAVLQKRKEKSHEIARRIRKQFGSIRAMPYNEAHNLALDISAKTLDYDVIAGYAKLEAAIADNRAEQPGEAVHSPVETRRITELGEALQEAIGKSSSQKSDYEVSVPDNELEESKKAYRKSKKAAQRLANKKAKQERSDVTKKGPYDKNRGKDNHKTEILPLCVFTGGELGEKTLTRRTEIPEGGGEGVVKTNTGGIALSTTPDSPHTTTYYRHHMRSHSVPPCSLLVPLSSDVVTSKDMEEVSSNNQSSFVSPAKMEAHLYQPLYTLRRWTYKFNPRADAGLIRAGFVLFDPPVTYVNKNPLPCTMEHPVIVLQSRTQATTPIVRFDEPTERIMITPHYVPWPDMRQNLEHPDWVPDQKLVEYQAVEYMGQKYWRHDRQHLVCMLPTCKSHTADHVFATVLCHGCGPKTTVRYCEQEHLLADLGRHWSECGHPQYVIGHPIDEMTQPSRFYDQFPAIKDIQDHISFEKHRQRAYAIENEGYYTLFHPTTGQQKTLKFVKRGQEHKNARIERLLNVALFDHTQQVFITYLYNYLNECLIQMRKAGLLDDFAGDAWMILKRQLAQEFKFDSLWMGVDRILCECDWFGFHQAHTYKSCKLSPNCQKRSGAVGEIIRGTGIKDLLDTQEGKHWILRIWRRQDTDEDWRLRMQGKGFREVSELDRTFLQSESPGMGEGWDGWGHLLDQTKV